MEEHFKNKLKNHKVDWDKESLLGNLEDELSPRKSRFNWKWFLLLPLVLISTCWGWNNLQIPASKNIGSTTIKNEVEVKENKEVKDAAISQNSNENDHLNSNPNQYIKEKKSEQSQSNSETKQAPDTSQPKTEIKPNLELNKNQNTDPSRTLAFYNPYKTEAKKFEQPSRNFLDIKTVGESAISPPSKPNEAEKKNLILNPIPYLAWKELDFIDIEANLPEIDTTEIIRKQDENSTKTSIYFSPTADIGLIYRSRKFDSDNADFVSLLENNEETEKSLFAIRTSLYIGYEHTSNWSIQSGLEYNELKEVFNYKETGTETLSEEKIRYIIVENMDTLYVLDTINVFRTTERTIRHFNKHTYYSIPLQLGYRFDLKKAKLITRLGLSYAFAHNFKGKFKIFNDDSENGNIYEDNREFGFELKNRIGLQAGIAIEYPFFKQGLIFATATYRSSPSLTLGIIEQRHHSLSLGAGFKFILN